MSIKFLNWDEVIPLVCRAQAGDTDAYGELTEAFRAKVYTVALRNTRNEHEAHDLTQDVFLHAMRKLPQLREPRAFGGWLQRMTVRMAINRRLRNKLQTGGQPELLAEFPDDSRSPSDALELMEVRNDLHDALAELKPLDRATLEAFYLRNRNLKQMGKEFEVPIGTIKRRLHVARARLKDVLERHADPSTKRSKKPRAMLAV